MNTEDTMSLLCWIIVILFAAFLCLISAVRYWRRQANLANQKLVEVGVLVQCSTCHYRWEPDRWSACPCCAKSPTMSIEEYQQQRDSLNRKSRPGSPTSAACPKCNRRLFSWLGGNGKDLFCKNCPYEYKA